MSIYYHYCSVSAFFGMASSKRFWLSSIKNMNDRHEVEWAMGLLSNVLNEKLSGGVDSEKLREIYDIVRVNVGVPYIASFSRERDMLGQWRGYADDGKGVCVGFDFDVMGLEDKFTFPSVASYQHSIGYRRVLYNESEQRKLIEEKVDNYLNGDTESGIWLSRLPVVFKDPSFQAEQEVRVVHTPYVAHDANGGVHVRGAISDLEFRCNGEKLISHFSYEFPADSICEVTVGPKCSIDLDELKWFLLKNNFTKCGIARSQVPYR